MGLPGVWWVLNQEGFVTKRSGKLRPKAAWKRKYLRLRGRDLVCSASAVGPAERTYAITDACDVKRRTGTHANEFEVSCMDTKKHKLVSFCAFPETSEEATAWVAAIQAAVRAAQRTVSHNPFGKVGCTASRMGSSLCLTATSPRLLLFVSGVRTRVAM